MFIILRTSQENYQAQQLIILLQVATISRCLSIRLTEKVGRCGTQGEGRGKTITQNGLMMMLDHSREFLNSRYKFPT